MLSNNLLALAVIYVSVFCTGASFKCLPREKEISKPMRSSVETNCQLDNFLQPDEYLILEKGETEIGQCSLHGCVSTDPNSFELSLMELKCSFQINDLEADDSGAYYVSLRNTSSVLFNRVLALNLSVNQIIAQQPSCGMNLSKSSLEIELSCEVLLHSYAETSLQLTIRDNGTEVNVNSHVFGVSNVVKSATSLNAILTGAIVPRICVSRTSQKSNSCTYPQYTWMNIVVTEFSFIGCSEKQLEVWVIISKDFKLLKLLPLKPTVVDTRMANGHSFIVICGMETRGFIDIRSITKVKVKEYDTCYTARVEETWLQTRLKIVPGCVSTPKFDPSSYKSNFASITPNLSLPKQVQDYSTEIPTTVGSNSPSTVYFTLNGPTTKQMSKKLNRYLKYATLLCIVATVALLFTITSFLFLAHQKMNTTDGKNLRLQYYRYDRQADDLVSVRTDDLATASTANLTSLLVNSLNGSQLDFSQVQSVFGSDGCNGEVSRPLVHRPALPPRGHPGELNHKAYHGRRINSAEVGKANVFAMVTSKCDQTDNYPPARPARGEEGSEEGKCTVLDPDPDIQVKELLYAKPNKKGKLTSLSPLLVVWNIWLKEVVPMSPQL